MIPMERARELAPFRRFADRSTQLTPLSAERARTAQRNVIDPQRIKLCETAKQGRVSFDRRTRRRRCAQAQELRNARRARSRIRFTFWATVIGEVDARCRTDPNPYRGSAKILIA